MKSPNQDASLVKHEPQALARAEMPAINVEALITKAIEQGSAFEVMKELESMRQRVRAENAEEAFNQSMADLQSEMPVITKDKGVSTNAGTLAYKYAPIETIEVQIRPFLQKHGFNHTFDTDTSSADGWVIAKCIVSHRAGHKRESTAKFPLGTKTAIMSSTQQFAAALTFANRRVLCNAYGIVLAGEDMDGLTGKPKPQGPSTLAAESSVKSLAEELWKLLTPIREKGAKNWNASNQFLWKHEILDGAIPEELPNLSVARFKEVIAKAKELPELKG